MPRVDEREQTQTESSTTRRNQETLFFDRLLEHRFDRSNFSRNVRIRVCCPKAFHCLTEKRVRSLCASKNHSVLMKRRNVNKIMMRKSRSMKQRRIIFCRFQFVSGRRLLHLSSSVHVNIIHHTSSFSTITINHG